MESKSSYLNLLPANFQATSRFTHLKKHWCSIFNSIYIFTWPLHQYSKYQIVHISPHQSKHPIINKFQVRGFGDHLTKLWDHQTVIKSAKVIKTVRYSLMNLRPSPQPIKVAWSSLIKSAKLISDIITDQNCPIIGDYVNDHHWSSLQLAKLHLLNQFLDGQHVGMLRTIIIILRRNLV